MHHDNCFIHSSPYIQVDHAVYALKNAKEIPALKAISQNLMHANLSVTDGIYGILSDMDVKQQISALGKDLDKSTSRRELILLLRDLIKEHDKS